MGDEISHISEALEAIAETLLDIESRLKKMEESINSLKKNNPIQNYIPKINNPGCNVDASPEMFPTE
ncbi:MAG: hypothetical protein V1660_01930 [archaeon]